jgi:hypothetical protein
VTFFTIKASLNMPLMRKIKMVGQVMYLYPRDWLFIFPELLKFLYFRRFGLYDVMTTHTFSNAGHARMSGTFGVYMTVLTRDRVLSGVDDVTKLYRLSRSPTYKIGITYLPTHQKSHDGDYNTYN